MRKSLSAPDILVLGVGHPWRGDDGAGRAVARRLHGRWPAAVEVREVDGEASALVAAFAGRVAVFVADAVVLAGAGAEAEPGTIHRLDAAAGPLPAALATPSTHGFGVAQAIELARQLGRLPRRLIVYAVVGRDFTPGTGLSPAVEQAAGEVAERIADELESLIGHPPSVVRQENNPHRSEP